MKERVHGVEIDDPYRWLEDAKSEDTKKWIDEQNRSTFTALNLNRRHFKKSRMNL